jgi:hypothetical protein
VRGCHDSHVHADAHRASEAFDLLVLEDPQQLGLHFRRQIANLVEEDRRPMRQLESPDLPRDRVGVGAALTAEQFALDQRGRDTVPVSPSSRTVALVGATCSICSSTRRAASLHPTRSCRPN